MTSYSHFSIRYPDGFIIGILVGTFGFAVDFGWIGIEWNRRGFFVGDNDPSSK